MHKGRTPDAVVLYAESEEERVALGNVLALRERCLTAEAALAASEREAAGYLAAIVEWCEAMNVGQGGYEALTRRVAARDRLFSIALAATPERDTASGGTGGA